MRSLDPTAFAARTWLDAARDAEVAGALESIFAEAGAAIAARGPACWASGRCCNFEGAGHLLYTTALEAAYTLVRALGPDGAMARPSGAGSEERRTPGAAVGGTPSRGGASSLALPVLTSAASGEGCPFQARNLCSVHAIKPVACRVYFCDRSAQSWQHDLSERLHERMRALHEARGIPYLYAEWRGLLSMLGSGLGPGAGAGAVSG